MCKELQKQRENMFMSKGNKQEGMKEGEQYNKSDKHRERRGLGGEPDKVKR